MEKTLDEKYNRLSETNKIKYHKINVPPGIRYISQWSDFHIPDEPHIMDKSIPGCGFTEYCLTNNENIVLCSPRKILLQNKYDQHIRNGDRLFLVRTKLDRDLNTDKDISDNKQNSDKLEKYLDSLGVISDEEYKTTFELIVSELGNYIDYCNHNKKSIKILVTYDSFYIVKQVLEHFKILEQFRIVVDEWQSIFTDSRFKSDTEMTFINNLEGLQKVCYLSATPMMLEYIEHLDMFKNLPYYELDWGALDPTRIHKPNLKIRTINSVVSKGKEIIQSYLDGKFERIFRKDGTWVDSKECVIYVNSVRNICSIIRGMNLKPEQVNILVANTPDNISKIHSRIGKNFNIGKIPTRDEPNKMFTLCTRTVYLGADFYSDNARSFIFSDANIETLAVDISLDLPQIMGRQRDEKNPWWNEAEFYYKPITKGNYKKLGDSDFQKELQKKFDSTRELLTAYSEIKSKNAAYEVAKLYKKAASSWNYKNNYVAVNRDKNGNLIPCFNDLVLIAEKRAFDIQKFDYQDRFSVFNSIDKSLYSSQDSEKLKKEMHEFYKKYDLIKDNIQKKLKLFCESNLSEIARDRIYDTLDSKTKSYLSLGKDKLKSIEYLPKKIEELLNNSTINIDDIIYSKYHENDRLIKTDLKQELQNIYNKIGLKKKAKATDINKWFDTKPYKDKSSNKPKLGFLLIKKK